MDWINQNKVKNWLIAGLLTVNVLTIFIIWLQMFKNPDRVEKSTDGRKPETVALMQKELEFDDSQTKALERIRTDKLQEMKKINDSLDALKVQMAESLFAQNADTDAAVKTSELIGRLQAKVELIRFQHFKELLAICTPAQKEKMKPVIKDFFGKKPPKNRNEEAITGAKPLKEKTEPRPAGNPEPKDGAEQPPPQRQPPPQIDDKIDKYSRRLNLSEEQIVKLREIFASARKKDEELRARVNPDRDIIEQEKEKNRREQDAAIERMLTPAQKIEFEKMKAKRR